jgi:ABC-type bacteriocin/lantibiotic exporter with double-glycine peptidase domain
MFFILFFVAVCCDIGYAAQEATNRVFDCGVNTVYFVLRIKGMDADLKEISGRLQRDAEKGSSIHDLETYLHSVGLKTDARLMRLSDLCKKRGTLAILLTHAKEGAGHFVVARVLSNGHLQVVDSLLGTSIDENAIRKKERHPVILIDPQGHEWTWKLFALASLAMLGFLGFVFIKRQRAGITDER